MADTHPDRNQDLQELLMAGSMAGNVTDLNELKNLFYRVQTIATQHAADPDVQAEANRVRQIVAQRGRQLQEQPAPPLPSASQQVPTMNSATPPAVPPPIGPPPSYAPPVGVTGGASVQMEASRTANAPLTTGVSAAVNTPPRTDQPTMAVPPPAPPKPPAPPSPPAKKTANWKLPVIGGGVIGLLLAVGVIFMATRKQPKAGDPAIVTPTGDASVQISTTPKGARVKINGQDRGASDVSLQLPPGDYKVEINLPGYQPLIDDLKAESGKSKEMLLALTALPQTVRILTDLTAGKFVLDQQPPRDLVDGQLLLENLSAGNHTARIYGPQGELSFQFSLEPGRVPVTNAVAAKNAVGILVGGLGEQARVQTSVDGTLTLDTQVIGPTAPGGNELKAPAGDHELVFTHGETKHSLVVGFNNAPTLSAYLKLDLQAGTLVILTNGEDDAAVSINGKPVKGGKTRRGQLRLPNLPPGTYKVALAKVGYQPVPEQSVTIKKGEETKAVFELRPSPKVAALSIRGAMPGASVYIDGQMAGVVRPDGTLTTGNIAPGDHPIEFRLEGYETKRVGRKFEAGQTVDIEGEDTQLARAKGTIRLALSPSNAKVSYRRDTERTGTMAQGNSLQLPEGTYVLTATAQGFQDKSVTVQIAPGQTRTAELTLTPASGFVTNSKPASTGMENWLNPEQFRKEGEWFIRDGNRAEYALFNQTPTAGTISWQMQLKKRGGPFSTSKPEWVADFEDGRNHVRYILDDKRLTRQVYRNGKKTEKEIPHSLGKQEVYTLQLIVKADGIEQRVNGVPLDQYSEPNENLGSGRFGLRSKGGTEIGISQFRFAPSN